MPTTENGTLPVLLQYRNPLPAVLLALGMVLLPPGSSHAGESSHREFSAHEHGSAELTVALEGSNLEIHLVSPAMNVVGFEHRAKTDEQIQAVEKAGARLKSAEGLFEFTGTTCTLQQSEVDVSAVSHDDDAGHENAPERDHDKEHEQNHDEDHGHSHADKEVHSDISARYNFQCSEGSELKSISTELVGPAFAIETLDVMWVTELSQGATELTTDNRTIQLRQGL